jgi:hypothetical protein
MLIKVTGNSPITAYPAGIFTRVPGSGPIQLFQEGRPYLLRDDALTAHAASDFAAGDVLMSPGPGVWTEGGEAGLFSVASGWIEVASHANLHYIECDIPIIRQVGQVITCRWRCANTSVTNPSCVLSLWDDSAKIHGVHLQNGIMYAFNIGQTDIPILPSFTLNVAYDSAIILTATGAQYFYKLSTDAIWQNLGLSPGSITNTPLYVGIEGYDSVFSVTNIHAFRRLDDMSTELLLLETGDLMLLETGDYLLLEASYG